MFEEMSFSIQRAFLNYARNSKTYLQLTIDITNLSPPVRIVQYGKRNSKDYFEYCEAFRRFLERCTLVYVTHVRGTKLEPRSAQLLLCTRLMALPVAGIARYYVGRTLDLSLSLSLSIRLVRDDNSLALFLHLLIPKREYSKGEQRWINNWPFIIPPPYRRLLSIN